MGDTDKKTEDIIEETMQAIYNDLKGSDDSAETDGIHDGKVGESNERPEETDQEDRTDEKETGETSGGDDTTDLSFDDDSNETEEHSIEDNMEHADDEHPGCADGGNLDSAGEVIEDEGQVETEAQKEYRKHKRRQRAGIVAACIVGVLALVYGGFAFYFGNHFMPFTKVNGTDVSFKSVGQVEDYLRRQVDDYVLVLKESDGGTEEIKGADISLKYVPGNQLKKIIKNQGALSWIVKMFNHPDIKAEVGVEYDKEALGGIINALECVKQENQTVSVDAHPEFKDTEFVIVPEIEGTQIDMEKFTSSVQEAVNGFNTELDLAKAGCYILPRFKSDSNETLAARDAMNHYLRANVTYDFTPYTEVVDSAAISQWVKVDGDMNVTFDQDAVKAYIQSLADKYDTRWKTRTFTTANGNVVNVNGGDYGWEIDQDAEYGALTANIQNGETVTREPHYLSRGASHEGNDVGNTYAEVDLSNQVMYYVQNGQVIISANIVTGNPNKGHATPQGTYTLAYKALNQTLVGEIQANGKPEYETPVDFWMPFNGGIGFHDAVWQPAFGGSLYQTVGSHGCVNLAYDVASQLYNNITAGTPVVVHF